MTYRPGVHIIAELSSKTTEVLNVSADTRHLLEREILRHELTKLGEVYHDFQPAGFTGVVCLSESHISVHTWPEFNRIHLDIYLSNYNRINDEAGKSIFASLVELYKADVLSVQYLNR